MKKLYVFGTPRRFMAADSTFCRICDGLGNIPHRGELHTCGECRGTGLANPPPLVHPGDEGQAEYDRQIDIGPGVLPTGPTIEFQGREVAGPRGGARVMMQLDEEGNPTNEGLPFGGIFTRSAAPMDAAWAVLKADPAHQLMNRYLEIPYGYSHAGRGRMDTYQSGPAYEIENRLGTVHPAVRHRIADIEAVANPRGGGRHHIDELIADTRYIDRPEFKVGVGGPKPPTQYQYSGMGLLNDYDEEQAYRGAILNASRMALNETDMENVARMGYGGRRFIRPHLRDEDAFYSGGTMADDTLRRTSPDFDHYAIEMRRRGYPLKVIDIPGETDSYGDPMQGYVKYAYRSPNYGMPEDVQMIEGNIMDVM